MGQNHARYGNNAGLKPISWKDATGKRHRRSDPAQARPDIMLAKVPERQKDCAAALRAIGAPTGSAADVQLAREALVTAVASFEATPMPVGIGTRARANCIYALVLAAQRRYVAACKAHDEEPEGERWPPLIPLRYFHPMKRGDTHDGYTRLADVIDKHRGTFDRDIYAVGWGRAYATKRVTLKWFLDRGLIPAELLKD